jgi:adenine-specific DNA-methyltransferase
MRYIGNKTKILDFIDKATNPYLDKIQTVFDAFSGTGSVALHFKQLHKNVITNDFLYFCYVIEKGLLCLNRKIDTNKYLDALNKLKPIKNGFIHSNYTPKGKRMFYTEENGILIDTIRKQIEVWYKTNKIPQDLYFYLLTCLIYAIDKVSNITGVYTSYLKKFQSNALKRLNLVHIDYDIVKDRKFKCYNQDLTQLKVKENIDLLYLDPPYNARQYSQYYHLLETIAKYDNPKIHGIGGLRGDNKLSPFSQKDKAQDSMIKVIDNNKSKYILISYNSEGIISKKNMISLLKKYGSVKLYSKKYKRYVSNKNQHEQKAEFVYEYLFFCDRTK